MSGTPLQTGGSGSVFNNSLGGGGNESGFVLNTRTTAGDTTAELVDSIIEVSVGSAPVIVTVSATAIAQVGYMLMVKDVSGFASRGTPIHIQTPGAQTLDEMAQLSITSPYGSLSIYSDGTNLWTLPWNSPINGSLPTTFYRNTDDEGSIAVPYPLVTLPLGPTSVETVSLWLDVTTITPFMTSDLAGTSATVKTFTHDLFNGSYPVISTPNSLDTTVSNGTNYYFTADNLFDANVSYVQPFSFGRLTVLVEGDSAGSTPLYQVDMKIISQGFGSSGNPLVTITGTYHSVRKLKQGAL